MKGKGRTSRRIITLLAGIGILTSILVVMALVGDLREVSHLLASLHWQLLVWIALLAVANHGLRYWRWDLLLKRISSRDFKRSTNVLVFLAGSLLIFTPGRAGEVAKSVYARNLFGIPMATSLPILIAERIADIAVMAALASVGLLLLGETSNLCLAVAVLGVATLVFVAAPPLLRRVTRWRVVQMWANTRIGQMLGLANESRRTLLAPRTLGTNLALGTGAWTVEVLIYFFSLAAVGATMEPHLFVLALAVFPLASLGGSLSFLPGGLGATEGGLVALAILLGGTSAEMALLAALISRVAILGVIVVAGLLSLPILHRGSWSVETEGPPSSDEP